MTKRLWRALEELVHGRRCDLESAEELLVHVEMAVAEKIRAGVDEAAARREVRLELGHPLEARERLFEGRTGSLLDGWAQDTAYAFRLLRKRKAFSLLCVLTIAVGVGASTALFAVVDAVLLRPLPFPDPEALVRVFDTNSRAGIEQTGITTGNLADWSRRARLFRGIAGYYSMGRTLSGEGESEVVLTAQVSADFFEVLGQRALVGRTFTPEEVARGRFNSAAAPTGADPVVVLGHGLWQRRFGGDPQVLGRSLTLERRSFRVVGVMPAGFDMPDPGVQMWIPWDVSGDQPRDQHYLGGVARLEPSATPVQAAEDLNAVAEVLAREHPATNEGWGIRLVPLQEALVGDSGRTLWILLAAVGLLLVVACANVAVLSLARGLERTQEASVRLALGATRGRLLRQFLLESLLVAAAGGALGTLLAVGAVAGLRVAGASLPRVHEVALDPRALLFAVAVTTAAALIAGLPYAWRRARVEPVADLTSGTSRLTEGRGRHLVRDGLVVAEIALAVVLLAGASLLVRSYERLRAQDPGFDPRGVLVAPIFLDMEGYGSGGKSRAYYTTLLERLQALPGVLSAGGATALPTSPFGPDFARPVWPEEAPTEERSRRQAWVRIITPRYFETLGMRVVAGRAFEEADGPRTPRAVILSAGLARQLWPKGDATGRRLVVDYSSAGTYPYDVVGVVSDVRFGGPRSEPHLEIYIPHAQAPYLVMNVAVKTTQEPWRLTPAVRAVLHDLDPQKPAHGLHALEDLLGATYSRDRQAMMVLAAFAAAATLLALFGVHGVLLHRVRERTREIGIRMAIGAGRRQVLAFVAGHGLRLTGMGLALGLALATASARSLGAILFGVSPADPASTLLTAVIPLAALVVSLHPAWRATRIDAAEVLRRG
jgi:putative ABC transport system permease protein